MIGTVTAVGVRTVMVALPRDFPGQAVPCLPTIHRTGPDTYTEYLVGDRVVVIEDEPHVFRVAGLAGTPE